MSVEKQQRYFDLIMAVFVTVLIVSNVASSAKIVDLRFSVLGVPMAFDAGTILFPISYIFGDILTEVYGYRRSRRAIWTGFFCLGLASLVFFLVSRLPGEATWQQYAGRRCLRGDPGRHEHRRDRPGKPGRLLERRIHEFIRPGKDEGADRGSMAVDAHHREHDPRPVGGYRASSWLSLRSFGVFPWSLFITLTLTNYLFKVAVEALHDAADLRGRERTEEGRGRGLLRSGHELQSVRGLIPLAPRCVVNPNARSNHGSRLEA